MEEGNLKNTNEPSKKIIESDIGDNQLKETAWVNYDSRIIKKNLKKIRISQALNVM